jgi:glycosyltransferase 2 family protein
MTRLLRLLPYLLVLAFAVWCALALHADLRQISLVTVLHAWDLVAAAAVLSLLNYLARIFRWRWYLARLGYHLPSRFAALTFVAGFAYTLSPGKVGEMVRARYYVPLGVPVSKVAAAFFAERLLDLVAMMVLAVMLLADSARYRPAILAACVLVALLLAVVALLPWPRIATACESMHSLPRALRNVLLSVTSALSATRPLLRPLPLAVGFATGLLAWGFEGLGLGVLAGVIPGGHLDLFAGVGVYAVAVLVGALSFLPGGLGSTEAVMTTLLVAHGFAVGDAVFVTLACRLVTLWLAVLLGWVAVLFLRQRSLTPAVPWQ